MRRFAAADLAASEVEPDELDEEDFLWQDPEKPQPKCPASALWRLKAAHGMEPEELGEDHLVQDYRQHTPEVWLQRGEECTGFALAAIANYHIRRRAAEDDRPVPPSVSARMLYEMAQDNDGKDAKEASTLRGALKGWRKLGVVTWDEWPYHPDDEHGQRHGRLTVERVLSGHARPGGYFYRIPKTSDIDEMKHALSRGFPLYVGVETHAGWSRLYLHDTDNTIHHVRGDKRGTNHACVIAGYDETGFWIHNSWGRQWGDRGFGRLPYEDWRKNGHDVWVVVPDDTPELDRPWSAEQRFADDAVEEAFTDMWRHLLVIGDDGRLIAPGDRPPGQESRYEMDRKAVRALLWSFKQYAERWEEKKRLVVFADGGYRSPESTTVRLQRFKNLLMENQIYPIFLVWEKPWFDSMEAWLYRKLENDGRAGRKQTEVGTKREVMYSFAPRAWREMARRARRACADDTREPEVIEAGGPPQPGAAQMLARAIARAWTTKYIEPEQLDKYEVHLMGHGVGDMLLSRFAQVLADELWGARGERIESASLWAPATTVDWFHLSWAPLLEDERVGRMAVFALEDRAERADRVGPVPKSILYLASDILAHRWDSKTRAAAVKTSAGADVWAHPRKPVLGLEACLFDEQLGDLEVDRRIVAVEVEDDALAESCHHTEMVRNEKLQRDTVAFITKEPVREAKREDGEKDGDGKAEQGRPELHDIDGMSLAAAAETKARHTTSQLRKAWEHALCDAQALVRVGLPVSDRKVSVHRDAQVAFTALHEVMERHGYVPRPTATGSFSCRKITGSSHYSLHAYGIAADYNWDVNVFGSLQTDMPDQMVAEILDLRTPGGHPIFRWGGHYPTRRDPMHFEVVATPAELAATPEPTPPIFDNGTEPRGESDG